MSDYEIDKLICQLYGNAVALFMYMLILTVADAGEKDAGRRCVLCGIREELG